jgi:hypothetical protein
LLHFCIASLRRRLIMMIIDSEVEYYGGKNEVNGGEKDSGAAQCTFLRLLLCVHLPLRVFFAQNSNDDGQ